MEKGNTKKIVFKLPPYKQYVIGSLEEAKQKAGWGITAFNLPDTWKLTQGEGVKIAVLDTGCDLDHPDLINNLLPGANFINCGAPPEDDNSHGSHCAGIICAENNDIGMVGVAPKAKIMPVKVLDKHGSGDLVAVTAGIKWALANGADIIAMSLGCPAPVAQVRAACQLANQAGVPVFCAAGNAGKTKDVFYPACYPETIAIGAIDESFSRSSFSNTGVNLDFMAPGSNIFSTIPDNWYGVMSGTSMACPFAVGVAALLLSYVRNHKTNITLKSVDDYRNALKAKTIPIKDLDINNKKFFEGFGILDPKDIIEWAETVK